MNESAKISKGLVLVGYRGTGKSTVGRIVAERLGLGFVDADAALEALEGRPVRVIFEERGEAYFRDREEHVLAELTTVPRRVIATGGGAVLRESNRQSLADYGLVVWLTAAADVLKNRLGSDPANLSGRPSLTPLGTLDEIAKVLDARLSLYKAVSDIEISTEGRSPSEVADIVIAWLPSATFDHRGASS